MGECCKGLCKSLIVFLDVVVALVGLCIVGVASYLIYKKDEYDVFRGEDVRWVIWVPFAFGMVLVLMSLLNCCVTLKEKRCVVGLYAVIQLTFAILIAVAGGALMVYTNYLNDIAEEGSCTISDGIGNSRHYLSDYETGMYVQCCITDPAGRDAFISGDPRPCIYNQDAFDAGNATDAQSCQVLSEAFEVCSPSATGSLAGLKDFQSAVASLFEDAFWPAGVAMLVFALLIFLAFFGSCYLACCASPHHDSHKRTAQPSEVERLREGARPVHNERGMTMT